LTQLCGLQSKWADLFIRYQKFWCGEPKQEELDLIYTRKPRPPFREVEHADGTVEKVWCTFDTEQIDIDVFSPLGAAFIKDQLCALTDKCEVLPLRNRMA
jgi:sucrose phosphorylase